MSYRYQEGITHADAAFQFEAADLDDLLRSAADATLCLMVEDCGSVEPRTDRVVELRSKEEDPCEIAEDLVFELLQRLIYFKDTERLLLRVKEIRFANEREVRVVLSGEEIDARRHELGTDVKGVTLHRFKVTRDSKGWTGEVVLDV